MLRQRAKRIAQYAGVSFALLFGAMAARAASLTSRQPAVPPVADKPVDAAPVAAHLGELVRARTISESVENPAPAAELDGLRGVLERAYPRVHARLEREIVGDHALLYTWRGSAPGEPPIILCAHQDVVPVEPGTEGHWERPPFGGDVAGGFVWGRGAIDDKASLVAILAAAEALLEEGWAPRRTIYFAFGHDEEISGGAGAGKIVELLASRGVHAEAAFDEGNPIIQGIVPSISGPVAPVGVGEKGYLTLELTVDLLGGHSATPARETAYRKLSRAVERLLSQPMPARFDGATREFFAWTAPEMSFGQRMVFANVWLTWPVVARVFEGAPALDASVRTTTAVTVVKAGVKDNVVPRTAEAEMNFRVLPGDTTEAVIAHVRQVIDDEGVKIEPQAASRTEPSRLSPSDSRAFGILAATVREVFPGTVVAPALALGASDGRKYDRIADGVYRFVPFLLSPEDMPRIHGTNERVSVQAVGDAVRYYRRLLTRLAA